MNLTWADNGKYVVVDDKMHDMIIQGPSTAGI